jgi:hypothetical protein
VVQKPGSRSYSRWKNSLSSSSIREFDAAVSVEDKAKECIKSTSDFFLNSPLLFIPLSFHLETKLNEQKTDDALKIIR